MNDNGSIPHWDGSGPERWNPQGSHQPRTGSVDRTVLGPGPGQPFGPPATSGVRVPSLLPTVLITLFFGVFGLIPAVSASSRLRELGRPAGQVWGAFAAALVVAAVVPITLLLLARSFLPFGLASTSVTSEAPAVASSTGAPTGADPQQAVPTAEPPTSEPPATTRPPAAFPAGAQVCSGSAGPIGGFSQSAAGTDVTSCPFAESVRAAYGMQSVRDSVVTVQAWSPVTGKNYTMTCSGSGLVTCTGGTNAVVYLI
ncbi:hypothetical protein AADG42_15605 [Ammonicoccus fulvus]|uniref:DUF4190 domain-containing protein n=1 Tax=Ammonicoccus fulvus TaxID=3138240 RepID=A0ABZ3FSE3_9ACTN